MTLESAADGIPGAHFSKPTAACDSLKTEGNKLKTLVISTVRWPSPARAALALANAGFRVAAISPLRGDIRRLRAIDRHYSYLVRSFASSITYAINDWSPDLLVCADDASVRELHRIHSFTLNDKADANSIRLRNLIERSLGDPSSFSYAAQKSKLLSLAQSLGARCPMTILVPPDHVDRTLGSAIFPVLVKTDGAFAGKRVRVVHNKAQARRAMREFELPPNWSNRLKGVVASVIPLPFVRWVSNGWPAACLQEIIVGSPANRAVVCWQGEVLAGISVRAIKTISKFGPASVVEIVERSEMTETARLLVKHLKLSGFVGFDFMLDSADRAWLIEMNPRVVPVCYLGRTENTNLSAALFSRITGTSTVCRPSPLPRGSIALFPQELLRSPRSEYLSAGYYDVPWEEPELVLASLRSALRVRASMRKRMNRQNRQGFQIYKARGVPSQTGR